MVNCVSENRQAIKVVTLYHDESFAAPPSYHETVGNAVQLNEEGEHTLGSKPFNPMYPVYNFNSNQQHGSSPQYGFVVAQ